MQSRYSVTISVKDQAMEIFFKTFSIKCINIIFYNVKELVWILKMLDRIFIKPIAKIFIFGAHNA